MVVVDAALAVVTVCTVVAVWAVVAGVRWAVVGGGVAGVGLAALARSGPTTTMTSAPRVSPTGGGVGMACTAESGTPRSWATTRASRSNPGLKNTFDVDDGLVVLEAARTLYCACFRRLKTAVPAPLVLVPLAGSTLTFSGVRTGTVSVVAVGRGT